jgi:uroporphyrin-III C-methyltransferase/precorrin-2 dehydrogenase/sirohydrochlorin ferrochelatase
MRYFPAFLDLLDRPVMLIGGGELALRKARLLAKAGARLTVFAPDGAVPELAALAEVRPRPFAQADLDPRPALGVVATEDAAEADAAIRLLRAAAVPVNAVDRPEACDVVVPSIVERGDVAIGISTGGAAPVLGRRLRERIEALLPARLGELVAFARARRDDVMARVPADARRAFWERALTGPVATAVHDGDMDAAARRFDELLDGPTAPRGEVHIVGAGPGDPELLTLKALRLLQEADVVLHDHLVTDEILELVRRDAERICVGKRRADHTLPQEEIGALMVSLARRGKRVVRLKGGDPFIFGRGGEEVDALTAAGVPVSVVPGITAAQGCGAAANLPLTHRGSSQAVTYITAQAGKGEAPDLDWRALARLRHTLVVYMGVARAGQVAGDLIAAGMAPGTPAAIIENGTRANQRIVRTRLDALGSAIGAAGISGPATLVIGAVAARAAGRGLVDLVATEAVAA